MSSMMRSQQRAMQRRITSGMSSTNRPVVSEIIGRTTTPFSRIPVTWRYSYDWTRPEYTFWSRLARGKEPGYELGSLFAKRIAEIDAEWTLGDGFTIDSQNTDTDSLVSDFVEENLDTLMTWRKDSSKLGDAFLVVNPNGTLSLANPETVEILTDPLDATNVIGYRITTVLDTVTVVDEYTLEKRTVTFQKMAGIQLFGTAQVIEQQQVTFANLIGMLPVIHLPNDRESNEIYGHPIYEALLCLFGRYDDVIQKSLDGVEVMGRPIPVAFGLEDPEVAQAQNSTRSETVMDKDGIEHDVPVVDFEDMTMLWLGKGGDFKFAAPGSFSADSVAMLKKLFYLMMEHIGIPEWAWGGAVPGGIGGDSVNSQMPAFVKYLKGRRTQTQKAVRQLVKVWLAYKRLTQPVVGVDDFKLVWPELESKNEDIHLKKVQQASKDGLLTKETELRVLELVDNAAEEIEEAQQEADERAQQDELRMEAQVQAMIQQQNQQGQPQQQPPMAGAAS